MATKKAAGTAKNLTDSNPQYLGIKLYAGEKANSGSIIVRQRGSRILPGKNVAIGKDDTLYAVKPGIVNYSTKRKIAVDNRVEVKKVANVTEAI
jgi:large subunit ribosomal protein L27